MLIYEKTMATHVGLVTRKNSASASNNAARLADAKKELALFWNNLRALHGVLFVRLYYEFLSSRLQRNARIDLPELQPDDVPEYARCMKDTGVPSFTYSHAGAVQEIARRFQDEEYSLSGLVMVNKERRTDGGRVYLEKIPAFLFERSLEKKGEAS